MKVYRPLAAMAFIVGLAACGNAPQQPSDIVDDKTAEAPGFGLDPDISPDFEVPGETGDASVPAFGEATAPAVDPVETASLQEPSATLSGLNGRWGADESACAENRGVVAISTTRFESPERICDIASAVDGGNGSLTVTLSCPNTGGESDGDLVKLDPDGSGLQLSHVGGGEPPESLIRCP